MKILMISMFSNHFFNWTEQLKDAAHEIHWIDVYDSNTYVEKIAFVDQIIGWRNRIDYPGRYWIKKNLKGLDDLLNKFNQRSLEKIVKNKIEELKPDVVQSFVMQSATYPLVNLMKSYPNIKWIYSAWGNDLFFRKRIPADLDNIKSTLPHIDYMFADCDRDAKLANSLGFRGEYLGTFPGGGGYEFKKYDRWLEPLKDRKIILIKGYQGKLGRCNTILSSLEQLKDLLVSFRVIVFGANEEVKKHPATLNLEKWENFEVFQHIPHDEVLKLMGKSLIYIGNCISDGMPNTLLEAIIMGAFPIQSNPGGATEEIINDSENGLLIRDPENADEIRSLLKKSILNKKLRLDAYNYNLNIVKPELERSKIAREVNRCYRKVELDLK